ncbi:MAG: hypothetical protein ACLTYW_03470 [Collinsella sp.]
MTVDLSNTYLDWAERNMRQNGFVGLSIILCATTCSPGFATSARRATAGT